MLCSFRYGGAPLLFWWWTTEFGGVSQQLQITWLLGKFCCFGIFGNQFCVSICVDTMIKLIPLFNWCTVICSPLRVSVCMHIRFQIHSTRPSMLEDCQYGLNLNDAALALAWFDIGGLSYRVSHETKALLVLFHLHIFSQILFLLVHMITPCCYVVHAAILDLMKIRMTVINRLWLFLF